MKITTEEIALEFKSLIKEYNCKTVCTNEEKDEWDLKVPEDKRDEFEKKLRAFILKYADSEE